MRSTLGPGPYEGDPVLDRSGARVGVVEEFVVHGMHVSAIRVRLDAEDRVVDVPRDWFQETTREGLLLTESRERITHAE